MTVKCIFVPATHPISFADLEQKQLAWAMASFGGRIGWIGTSGEGVPERGSFKFTASVFADGDGTGTCSASFVTQRNIAFFFPFLFLFELATAHFLLFRGAVSVISSSTSSLHTFYLWNVCIFFSFSLPPTSKTVAGKRPFPI